MLVIRIDDAFNLDFTTLYQANLKRGRGLYEELLKLPIYQETLQWLEDSLPTWLNYHTVAHTKEVIQETLRLGLADGLPKRELELLGYAALFHDSGYVLSAVDHEVQSARFAEQRLAKSALLSPAEMLLVLEMVRDTKVLPEPEIPCQHASNKLSPYLLDADVANFGRDDFGEKLELAEKELSFQQPVDRAAFLRQTLALMNRHRWLSPAGERFFGRKKSENLQQLQRKLGDRI